MGVFSRDRTLRVQASGATDVGRAREHNEDAFLVALEGRLAVVADGMGGHNAGEVAAALALETIRAWYGASTGPEPAEQEIADGSPAGRRLLGAIRAANARVFEAAQADKKLRGMGSTVVAAMFEERSVHVAHAGDSRAYRLRGGTLTRLTRDHSLRAAMENLPNVAGQDLGGVPANVILKALGILPEIDVETARFDLERRDRYLLCSDGLSGMVKDDALRAILVACPSREAALAELIASANAAGGDDNITAILVDVG